MTVKKKKIFVTYYAPLLLFWFEKTTNFDVDLILLLDSYDKFLKCVLDDCGHGLFWVVLGFCGWFWMGLGSFVLLWVALAGCGWFYVVLGGSEWLWVVLGSFSWFCEVISGLSGLSGSEWFWFWMVLGGCGFCNYLSNIYKSYLFLKKR